MSHRCGVDALLAARAQWPPLLPRCGAVAGPRRQAGVHRRSRQLAGELAQLPIACTSWNPAWLQTLSAMGVTRNGRVAALPRSGVSRRLGPAAVLDLDIALARKPPPAARSCRETRFRERCDFETEIATVVYLQKALEPLVERCARFLRERQAGVQTVQTQAAACVLPPHECASAGRA